MPLKTLSHFILLPELKLTQIFRINGGATTLILCEKEFSEEICPKCANPSKSLYDKRIVKIKDAPLRGVNVKLHITKHRFYCRHCKKPFTQYIPGIRSRKRHTERFERSIRWAAETFTDLKTVRKQYRVSSGYLYKSIYKQLELRRRSRVYPWPKLIGIDEHSFARNKHLGITEFASMIVDLKNKRVMEVVDGKTTAALEEQLAYIPGRENVRFATLDLCDPFKNFVRNFFPNAELVADKFHVLRLLSPALLRKRKEITGTRADLRAKKLLLMSSHKLDYFAKLHLRKFLSRYPAMAELYDWKERLHGFYRIKGYNRARTTLGHILDAMAHSLLPEIKTLRKTLMKWRNEILNYFRTGLTNARVEGFNNKAKLVKRRAYGYKSFRNYRLRLLDACS
jgi:transposase